jgi:hypothetical protein
LTALQYRSLLINSTAAMTDAVYGGPARLWDVGSGLLDVNAALNAEAAVVPATLSLGVGDGTQTTNQTLTVTNAGSAADTFNLTVTPRDNGFTPQVSPSSLQLAPGASATVTVTIPNGPLAAGQYEGSIHVQGNNTGTDTHIPYWFGVPSTTPYLITDMGSDSQDTAGQTIQPAVVFRLTDAAGLRVLNPLSSVVVTYVGVDPKGNGNIVKGNGKVSAPYAFDQYSPGTLAVDVTMDTHRGYYNLVHAQAGNVGLDFYIQSQ